MHIYIVSYKNKPIAFMKYEDAINFIRAVITGLFTAMLLIVYTITRLGL